MRLVDADEIEKELAESQRFCAGDASGAGRMAGLSAAIAVLRRAAAAKEHEAALHRRELATCILQELLKFGHAGTVEQLTERAVTYADSLIERLRRK
jgi:hypothetical protein